MNELLLITSDNLFAEFLKIHITKIWNKLQIIREIDKTKPIPEKIIIDFVFPNDQVISQLTKLNVNNTEIWGLYDELIPKTEIQKITWKQKNTEIFAQILNDIRSNYLPQTITGEQINNQVHGTGQLIYFADDSKVVRSTLTNLLGTQNYSTSGYENGQLLLQALEKDALPDLILLDNEMPVLNGLQTLKQLKANEIWKEIPVLFISGVTEKDVIVKALEKGAADYISKPFYNNELFARVQVHLNLDRLKKQLILKNDTISKQYEEIKTQAQLLAESNKIIAEKKNKITASIEYAKRIQEAILPPRTGLKNIFPESFIFFRPLDIVSGDFYWYKIVGDFFVFTSADCTGHGVPGAFMSMLGIAFLNEILRKKNTDIQANLVLNELRSDIKQALKQTSPSSESKDGMDIALCVYNLKTKVLQYAGANNPLYLVRNNELQEFKADRMPVGVHLLEKDSFTNHIIEIKPGDMLYLFSDGYKDQFGGDSGQKFMAKNFKKMLQDISNKSVDEQLSTMENVLNQWIGTDYNQIDDVSVMGIRIS